MVIFFLVKMVTKVECVWWQDSSLNLICQSSCSWGLLTIGAIGNHVLKSPSVNALYLPLGLQTCVCAVNSENGSLAARLTRQFCCPVIYDIISSCSKHKNPPLTSNVFKSGCKYKPHEHTLHIPVQQAGMPLYNLLKIMEVDVKESAFYNTSWQVQYFPLFMNAGAGKKRRNEWRLFFSETNI